jgi:hypothetical protein
MGWWDFMGFWCSKFSELWAMMGHDVHWVSIRSLVFISRFPARVDWLQPLFLGCERPWQNAACQCEKALGAPAYGHPTYNGNPIMAYKKKNFSPCHICWKNSMEMHMPHLQILHLLFILCVCVIRLNKTLHINRLSMTVLWLTTSFTQSGTTSVPGHLETWLLFGDAQQFSKFILLTPKF